MRASAAGGRTKQRQRRVYYFMLNNYNFSHRCRINKYLDTVLAIQLTQLGSRNRNTADCPSYY